MTDSDETLLDRVRQRLRNAVALIACCVPLAGAFGHGTQEPGLVSPGGWASARVAQQDANASQVLITFEDGRCTAGSISVDRPASDARLKWLNDTKLQISVPTAASVRPPPGEAVENHTARCFDRVVSVVVARH